MSSNQAKKDSIWKRILACRELYLMLLLPVIWYILFLYTPMYGIMIAFKDYRAARGHMGEASGSALNISNAFSAAFILEGLWETH